MIVTPYVTPLLAPVSGRYGRFQMRRVTATWDGIGVRPNLDVYLVRALFRHYRIRAQQNETLDMVAFMF